MIVVKITFYRFGHDCFSLVFQKLNHGFRIWYCHFNKDLSSLYCLLFKLLIFAIWNIIIPLPKQKWIKLFILFQLAYSIGNDAFNNIMEDKLNTALKPTSSSGM